MSQRHTRNPDSTKDVISGILGSLLVHLAIVLSIVAGTISGAEAVEEKVKEEIAPFTPVELIALGEERPPDAMPRIANPEPVVAQEDAVNLSEPKKKKKPKPEKKKEDPPKKTEKKKDPPKTPPDPSVKRTEKKPSARDLLAGFNPNPDRPSNTNVPRGSPDGVAGGNPEATRTALNVFSSKAMAAVLRRWRVPTTFTDDQLKALYGKVVIYARISPEGHVVSFTVRKRSGNGQFDISAERAVKAFTVAGGGAKFKMPTDEAAKAKIVQGGITFRSWTLHRRK